MSNGNIYCDKCIFFVRGERIPYSFGPPEHIKDKCLAPQNFKDTYADEAVLPVSQPYIINRFNDCVWFIAKQEESSSSSSSSPATS
jgi:hypothetical protein